MRPQELSALGMSALSQCTHRQTRTVTWLYSRQLGNLTSNTIIVALLSAKPVFRPSAVGTDPLGWLNERVGLNAKNGWSLSLEFCWLLLAGTSIGCVVQSIGPSVNRVSKIQCPPNQNNGLKDEQDTPGHSCDVRASRSRQTQDSRCTFVVRDWLDA